MPSYLSKKKKYLQIALNSTLSEAHSIISQLPVSDRIIVEAGTPLIKQYGAEGIRSIKNAFARKLTGGLTTPTSDSYASGADIISMLLGVYTAPAKKAPAVKSNQATAITTPYPYVVADLKMMDRGETEVQIAKEAGADAAVALGVSPIESLNAFVEECKKQEIDSMIDMMNVEYPLAILRQLRSQPTVVILHRGVDEERFNKEKQIPLYEIRRIKSNYDVLISIAGGDTVREAQRAVFNDADIVIVWKSFYQNSKDTGTLAQQFLGEVS